MTFGSLFAGIGGFDLGLERAGMECRWQVEIDPYCQRVLAKHWPEVRRYGDIKSINGSELESVDLICGGFPCQPFSQAGKRQGKTDNRYLWPEMFRLITQARPAWVIGENVPGIIGMELDRVLLDLENQGYATRTFIIPACAVDAKHRRDRVWIVAHTARDEQGRQEQWTVGQRAGICGESIIAAHDDSSGRERTRRGVQKDEYSPRRDDVGHSNKIMGHANETRWRERWGAEPIQPEHPSAERAGEALADTQGRTIRTGLCADKQTGQRRGRSSYGYSEAITWLPEPNVGRVANGVPRRVDRLKGLGNAVVPQVVEAIGRIIMEAK